MKETLKICVATNNEHKMGELRNIFKGYNIELCSLNDLNIKADPEENGETYAENAFIKANEVAKFTSLPVLSDDSGIKIDAIGGLPGVHSHRFAEAFGGQEKTNNFLVKNYPNSKAHFTAHFVLLNLTPNSRNDFEGIMNGHIANSVYGNGGFGYDPIFVPEGYECTVASLSAEEKNKISHRYKASKAMLDYLIKEKYLWFADFFIKINAFLNKVDSKVNRQ